MSACLFILMCAMLFARVCVAAETIGVRVWPAEDYTRITLENKVALKAKYFTLENPDRLVVDVIGLKVGKNLQEIVSKIHPDDPYIEKARVAQNRPNVARIVFDLKAKVEPQVFSLKPAGNYKHRLVFDLYPSAPNDGITAFLERQQKKPAKKAPEPTPVSGGAKVQRMLTIVLDPGHGGEDPGAIGARGSKEKDVVLKIARLLKTRIEKEPNMRAVMTRNGDYFVPLHTRVKKGRKAKADLFISIHADAFIKRSARGASVFVLSERGASSTTARWLARKENAADLIGGANVKKHGKQVASVLLDLSTDAQIADSLKVGGEVLRQISGVNRLHKRYVEQAGFAVLKAPDVPSILIETAFISNPEEEKKLNNPRHQRKMADAILKGIKRYFAKNPPMAKGDMI